MEGGKEGKKNRGGGKTLVTKIPEMGKEGGEECRGSGHIGRRVKYARSAAAVGWALRSAR